MRKLLVKEIEYKKVTVHAGNEATERFAASEFLQYMEKIGISEGEGLNVRIYLDETIGRDGYRIAVKEDGSLEIAGGNGRGVLYGVYGFFEKYAGVRYFTSDLETLGEGDVIVNEDTAFTPAFEYRQSDYHVENEWKVKNHINQGASIPEKMGGSIRYGTFVHSMEYFLGVPQEKDPCLSDPENLKKVIAGVRDYIEKNPKVNIISVSQNDNMDGYCRCEKCTAVNEEEGTPAGTLIRFVNAVAADIAEDYPNVLIDTLAYRYSIVPPKYTKPLPNVCIRLCPISNCFSHTLADDTCEVNRKGYQVLKDWSKVCDRLYIWDYVARYDAYLCPFPNFYTIRENMRIYADHNVKGMYPEAAWNSENSGEFGELRCYLLAKMMWNPYMSANEYYTHMDEFLAAYYGAGWRYIRAYIDFMTMEAQQTHMKLYIPKLTIVSRDKLEAMEETFEDWWNKAEEMAGDRLKYVQLSRLSWQYMRLMMHPNAEEGRKLMEAVEGNNIAWDEGYKTKAKEDRLHLPPEEWITA
ncbi:MAG: DUF4838 domain-containing protein [Ruminococcaceae bacterium]|nr:DUF4838 domain-containing protein [Oscillospiraceae bacterium]